MTAAGTISIWVFPYEAQTVADWLRIAPPPLFGVRRINAPTLPNGSRLDLVEMLEALARRKRSTRSFKRVEMRLDRTDAAWFANMVAGGMFGGGWRDRLPAETKAFCLQCATLLNAKPGRRKLYGDELRKAATRQNVDDRHRKRLKARARRESMATSTTILGQRLFSPN